MLTRENIETLRIVLYEASNIVNLYREKAFARTKDDDFVDRNVSEAYGESTIELFAKGVDEPHDVVGASSSAIFLLRRLLKPENYVQERVDAINKNLDSAHFIFTYLLSKERDKAILNSLDNRFEKLAIQALQLIQEMKTLIAAEQKKIAESNVQSNNKPIFTEKSKSTLFSNNVKPVEEEHKQNTPPTSVVIKKV